MSDPASVVANTAAAAAARQPDHGRTCICRRRTQRLIHVDSSLRRRAVLHVSVSSSHRTSLTSILSALDGIQLTNDVDPL